MKNKNWLMIISSVLVATVVVSAVVVAFVAAIVAVVPGDNAGTEAGVVDGVNGTDSLGNLSGSNQGETVPGISEEANFEETDIEFPEMPVD